jgi:hypothetical protein
MTVRGWRANRWGPLPWSDELKDLKVLLRSRGVGFGRYTGGTDGPCHSAHSSARPVMASRDRVLASEARMNKGVNGVVVARDKEGVECQQTGENNEVFDKVAGSDA